MNTEKNGQLQTGGEQEPKKSMGLELSSTTVQEKESNNDLALEIPSDKIVDHEKVGSSPFMIVTYITENNKKRSFLTLGNHRISDLVENAQELRDMVDNKEWEILVSLVTLVVERVIEQVKIEDRKAMALS